MQCLKDHLYDSDIEGGGPVNVWRHRITVGEFEGGQRSVGGAALMTDSGEERYERSSAHGLRSDPGQPHRDLPPGGPHQRTGGSENTG